MKLPPIYATLAADSDVSNLLGDPLRLYVVGDAPETVAPPYVIWQHITGSPYAHLTCPPDMEQRTIQIDVYAASLNSALYAAEKVEQALEPHCFVTRYGMHERDIDTKHWRVSFDVNWHMPR